MADALEHRLFAGSRTFIGDEYVQIPAIANRFHQFFRECVEVHLMDPNDVEFVCEDFVPNLKGITGKEIVSPVRIMWGVEGFRMGCAQQFMTGRRRGKQVYCPRMILQLASQAKSFGTNKRLKEWDIWVVGREHERSAWSHVAYRLGKILNQTSPK